jgi:hypothetical protein
MTNIFNYINSNFDWTELQGSRQLDYYKRYLYFGDLNLEDFFIKNIYISGY